MRVTKYGDSQSHNKCGMQKSVKCQHKNVCSLDPCFCSMVDDTLSVSPRRILQIHLLTQDNKVNFYILRLTTFKDYTFTLKNNVLTSF